MPFAVGQNFKHKYSSYTYQIYDVTGQGGPIPSETSVIYLKLASRPPLLSNPQIYITITGRELLNHFIPVVHK